MIKIAVITVSDRVSRGDRQDISGPLAARLLSQLGEILDQRVIPDGVSSVTKAIKDCAGLGADVVFTTGGTGITGRDLTPEATEPLLEKRLTGIESRILASSTTPYAALSRGVVGIIRDGMRPVLVVNAPGSQGGVTDAIETIGPLLSHIVEQMNGGDHPAPTSVDTWDTGGPHAEATRKVQNRGVNDEFDADVVLAGVSAAPIEMSALLAAVDDPSAGAVVSFCGQVRNHDGGHEVVAIDYQAHPDANDVVARIAQEIAESSGA